MQEETYSGEDVQYRIADTLQSLAERLALKYGRPLGGPPEAAHSDTTDQQGETTSHRTSYSC
jgi:hypothetical protein